MDRHAVDYADARNMMVDGQIRPNKVTDERVLTAMRRLPRERFLPPELAARAYTDQDVPLPGGRVLVEPMVIARLVQMLSVGSGERALVIGAGPGYGAAVLAACGAHVTALEEDASLLAIARGLLAELAPQVALVEGALADGWPSAAPYDIVLIEGAVEHVPAAIAGQLKRPGGRLGTVRITTGRTGQAVLGEPVGPAGQNALNLQPVFDCATRVLPQLRRPPVFTF